MQKLPAAGERRRARGAPRATRAEASLARVTGAGGAERHTSEHRVRDADVRHVYDVSLHYSL